MASDLIGRTVSRYRVCELLGVGGMGVVYKAHDDRLGRPVALKFISGPLAQDDVALRQFQREARTASRLSHPNICTVYEIDHWEGQPFIAMELLSGETLKARLARGTLDATSLVVMAMQIASALGAAHKEDVIHRDVKPANIFLTEQGPAKLLDFGLAKQMSLSAQPTNAPSGGFTEAGRLFGTVNYMSPERLLAREFDQRSDLFSLGVVLYETVAGRQAFEGESVIEVIEAVLHNEPPPFEDRMGPQPHALIEIITRLIEKVPDDRYRNAAEVMIALEALRQDLDSGRAELTMGGLRTAPVRASVAVLPFRNLADADDNDYFADGLTAGVIDALAHIKGLKVAARESVFTFKGRSTELREIGLRLKVETVLYGTIRRSGDRLRVACRLTNVSDGFQIWSGRYDRDISETADVFDLEDDITRSIVEKLKVAWADRLHPRRRYTNVRASHDHYLKGRYYWSKRYAGFLAKASEQFALATAADEENALALAGQADVSAFLGLYSIARPKKAFDDAAEAAAAALKIDESLPEVHTSLGLVALSRWEWRAAEVEFKRAITLDPGHALAHMYYAWLLAMEDRPVEAIRTIGLALEADPRAPLIRSGAGFMYYMMRDYDQAIEECDTCDACEPNFLVGLYVKGMALMRRNGGDFEQAIPLIERATTLAGEAPFYLGLLGQAYAETGRRADVNDILLKLDGLGSEGRYVPPHCYVYIYASLGDKDRAFAWQDKACQDGAPPMYFMSPAIESLHKDPRHAAHLTRMHLAGQQANRQASGHVLGSPADLV